MKRTTEALLGKELVDLHIEACRLELLLHEQIRRDNEGDHAMPQRSMQAAALSRSLSDVRRHRDEVGWQIYELRRAGS